MTNFTEKYKIVPKIIVLQYFGNDIEGAAVGLNLELKDMGHREAQNPLLQLVIQGSYLINYFYFLSSTCRAWLHRFSKTSLSKRNHFF